MVCQAIQQLIFSFLIYLLYPYFAPCVHQITYELKLFVHCGLKCVHEFNNKIMSKQKKVKVIDRSEIRSLLSEKELSLTEVAQDAEVSLSAVSKFLKGINSSEKVAKALMRVLGVDKILDDGQEIGQAAVIGCTKDSMALSVRLPRDLQDYVVNQPNRSEWIRAAVQEKMERDLVQTAMA